MVEKLMKIPKDWAFPGRSGDTILITEHGSYNWYYVPGILMN